MPITAPEGFRPIVLAALIDDRRRVLTASRPQGKILSGWWEFPGGKIDPGESPSAALGRELREELAITVPRESLIPVTFAEEAREDRTFLLILYACRHWQGVPTGAEGQEIAWRELADLDRPWPGGGAMLASNARLIERLRRWIG